MLEEETLIVKPKLERRKPLLFTQEVIYLKNTIESLGAIRAALHYFLRFISGIMHLITLWAITSYTFTGIGFVTMGANLAEIAEIHKDFSVSASEYLLTVADIVAFAMIMGYVLRTKKINLTFENALLLLGVVIGVAFTPKLTESWQNGFGILDENLSVILWLLIFLAIKFLLKADTEKIEEYGCLSIETHLTDAGKVVVINGQTILLSDQTAEKEQQQAK